MKLLINIFIVLLIGCASVGENRSLNKRIVYRNLAPEPKSIEQIRSVISESEAPTLPKSVKKPRVKNPVAKEAPRYFVEFKNESTIDFDQKALDKFIKVTPNRKVTIMVVGYSHGLSDIGTLQLATKRAEKIRNRLIDEGYVKIHTMASWGQETVPFAPDRGVFLYVLSGLKGKEKD